ncbi:ABC transporter ATP-binding protein [Clostridium estertheticum]|uniref:Quaternary amine transport ATP-binding protein n=1 Tax=Clostridium estertheticum subsp. estertheticum TaxID=1552 RepID=A0A1J0GLM6_9CLOT|nr:ABC transporter ATP-binding protein [Clostridium estertheticum]APC42199.1 proline/glycine betaine ABC transporter ATP-binding protein [Clostridium estertheticum subsp. estertheticum]MBU3073712.1 ABC transporter ATP-binding protein [Clostridium estertheticum]MBU3163805.1 ABC transporter ATP-binding protein [Clostridium estertheticum]MBU3184225.1 ABC transporter ATP-binding protein [Clostridium estertheticum]MBZ9615880.1 ABC transporter ATP-binding protein [Clostridium estertheticum subsp. la
MIEFKNVSKSFNGRKILKDINITIQDEELVVFIGPSGCGKTTTLKMINKLITPTSGEVLINGKKIGDQNTIKLRRNMGYVIQQAGLLPHLTIGDNIALIPSIEKMEKEKLHTKVIELLTLVGLDPDIYIDKYPNQLSGGEQQRVGVARAFVMDPDVILMDEPFSALDPITKTQLQDEVFNIQQNYKKTIIFVTHDMDEALKLGDRICIMDGGYVVQFDTPSEILKNPVNDFVRDFVGKNRIWNQPELIMAKDIMIDKPVKSVGERTILQALEIMKSNNVDSLLVVDKGNTLTGLVTLKQIRTTLRKDPDKTKRIKDLMETKLITVNQEDSIINILEVIKKEDINFVPVVDDNHKLVGLLTKSSLLSILSNQFIDMEVDVNE